MEILGLVPCQSETQYLEQRVREVVERQQSGNMLPVCCRFFRCDRWKRQQRGNALPLLKALSSMSLRDWRQSADDSQREATAPRRKVSMVFKSVVC